MRCSCYHLSITITILLRKRLRRPILFQSLIFRKFTSFKIAGKARLPAFPATTTLYRNAEVLLKESISDNAYHEAQVNVTVRSASKLIVAIPADEHHDWYDFTIRVKGNDTFSQRYAGRFETGQPSKTDPFMGRV